MKRPSLLLVIALLTGCGGSTPLLQITDEPAGPNCDQGGLRVSSGVDSDKNGVLGVDEISGEHYVCDQVGANGLINTIEEPPGEHCNYGGLQVQSGLDLNANNALDPSEVMSSEYVCNQRVDGRTTLVDVQDEPVGPQCETGGLRVQSGFDLDENGTLEETEVQSTHYVCNGRARLIELVSEAAGGTCETGGLRVQSGFDTNGDSVLNADEVDVEQLICNGRSSLVKVEEVAPGGVCRSGGLRVGSGFDTNGDSVLNANEVQGYEYACHGEDAYDLLIDFAELPINGSCLFGGTAVQTGPDLNGNGSLDASEITDTQSICAVSVNENMTLVHQSVVAPGNLCAYGGTLTEVGVDANNDRSLQPSEVSSRDTVCHQVQTIDGLSTLLSSAPASLAQCRMGGLVLSSGLDSDRDGTLDPSEVASTDVVCNGQTGDTGLATLARTEYYSGAECASGGATLYTGVDRNRNGYLDTSEVNDTERICDGLNGYDGRDGLNGYDGRDSLIVMGDAGLACGGYGGVSIESGVDLNSDGYLGWSEVSETSYVCDGYDGYDVLIDSFGDYFSECLGGWGVEFLVGTDLNRNGTLDNSEVRDVNILCE